MNAHGGWLALPAAIRGEMIACARRDHPREACGLLVGARDGDRTRVARAIRARNAVPEREYDRYEIDPGDFVAADRAARELGLEIVGVWHSHPDRPAEPSEVDGATAWEQWSYVIVPVTRERAGPLRSWRFAAGRFREEELEAPDVEARA